MTRERIGIVGFGLIGQRWALAFACAGYDVSCYDPDDSQWAAFGQARAALEADIRALHDDLPPMGAIRFSTDLAKALADVDFVQENGPERIEVKQVLLASIEEHVRDDVIIASSSSALLTTEMQAGCRLPGRIVLGHPFNPAHLMLLVEVVGGQQTTPETIDRAYALYEAMGKRPVRMNREMTGHIALRLMGGMWREAFAMVRDGVATAADIDRAFIYGPGVKWTLQGSFIANHLGANGIEDFLEKFGPTYQAIWNDLGDARMDSPTKATIAAATRDALADRDDDALRCERDAGLVEILRIVARHGAL